MKRLFKFLLFAGIVTAVVVYVTNASRKRATGTQPGEPSSWAPPTVQPAEEETHYEPAHGTNGVSPAVEFAAGAPDEPGETAEAIEEALAEAELLTAEEAEAVYTETAADEALASVEEAIATDEGMPPAPDDDFEDTALDEAGDLVISELAEPGADEELLEAAADAAALDEEAARAVAEVEAALMAEGAAELASAPAIEALLDEAEKAGELSAGVVVLDTDAEPVEPAELAEIIEELAAPVVEAKAEPEPEPDAEPEAATPAGEDLFSSVEEALVDLEPAPIVPPPRRTAESYLDEGNVYFNVGQYGLAIERYGQAISMDDSLTAAYYNRANAHTRAGDFDKALADYDRALELQPLDADALNNRGMLHLYRTNYAAALSDFNRALEIDPSDTTVMVNRGLAQLHGGNAAAALVDFREAAQADESDAAAQYGAAQAAATMGNRDEALRHVARALEMDPAYAREAAADPRLALLSGDEEFLKLLRQTGTRTN